MHAPDEKDPAAVLSGPGNPQESRDEERPVPSRERPERTHAPADWDSASTEPITGRRPDPVADERSTRTGDERHAHAEGEAHEPAPFDDDESSYSTEQEQGAAQPGPAPGTDR